MARKLNDWLSGWLEFTENIEAPERFRLWSAVAAVSAALQRRVYVTVKGQRLYPNLYIMLVGPPGVGKGNAMRELIKWLRETDIHLAPEGLTRRAFYESLEDAKVASPIDPLDFSYSLAAFIEELGVFLHAGDNDFIYNLCHVYDNPAYFHYKTATAGEIHVENASFMLLAGATPKAIKDIFSEHAMELGISARSLLIFSDERVDVPIFGLPKKNESLAKDLQHDLRQMLYIHGEYVFTEDAAESLVAWSHDDFKPYPNDPRFIHYNVRRFVQITKLCIVTAASMRDDPLITLEDLTRVKTFLLEAERTMPRAIEGIGANPYLEYQQKCLKLINTFYDKTGKPTAEYALRSILMTDVPPQYLNATMDSLTTARWVEYHGDSPKRRFWPRGKMPESILDRVT